MTRETLHYAAPPARPVNAPLATLARRMLYFACLLGIGVSVLAIIERMA
jgi:hypothetical protein